MKGNGATKLGSRNSRGPNYWVEHPDGHPDAGGLNIPNHHGGGHIHAKNAKGQTIVIPYNNPAVFKPLDLSAEKAVSTNKTR